MPGRDPAQWGARDERGRRLTGKGSPWNCPLLRSPAGLGASDLARPPRDLPSPAEFVEGPPFARGTRAQLNPPGGIPCTYESGGAQMGGKTPKFTCRAADGRSIRVKYFSGDPHSGNREVFAEVVATRLFWALGFDADRVYPLTVSCQDCPADPMTGTGPRAARTFMGVTEPPFQGLLILSKADTERPGASSCRTPVAMIQDLGATYGSSGKITSRTNKIHLESWAKRRVFKPAVDETGKKGPACRLDVTAALTAGGHAKASAPVSEAGRKFLADQLARLSDAHIRAIFEAARLDALGDKVAWTDPKTGEVLQGMDAWVEAFKQKREQIAAGRCGQATPSTD